VAAVSGTRNLSSVWLRSIVSLPNYHPTDP
jgi:hypothetical protein